MVAPYDTYDYPSYWKGREYEHKSEVIAIKAFLEKILKIKTLIEIGAGYGRLTPLYINKASKITLIDPSYKLLRKAEKKFKSSKIQTIQSCIENLDKKVKKSYYDLVILVRVLHHIKDLDIAFSVIREISKKNGYLILEFANKRHLKAVISEFIHGNFTYLLDIFPKEIRSRFKSRKGSIPFINYHPDVIKQKLSEYGFSAIEIRSVSNIRIPLLKRIIPIKSLLSIEKHLQLPLARICFGPSIFILAKKVK